ncbi:MAG TPA: histidinol dehydrogenase [Anaerolineaceae bacterium]
MLEIIDSDTARRTVLRRQAYEETAVPPALAESLARLFGEPVSPEQAVDRILADVRARGDEALTAWAARLDGVPAAGLRVPPEELVGALEALPGEQRQALELAAGRIRGFHERQPLTSWITQELGGTLGQLIRPIRRVGLYVPAGTAPLPSSVLMAAIPAQVACVEEIAIVSPPERGTGRVSPVILAAAALLGIDEVYALGGAQAVAALAYGTPTVPAVDKIFGPGNLFVTLAKRRVFGLVGIDGLAGPTETVVIADGSARAEWVAADLLAQAEHDLLATALLLTPDRTLAEAVQVEVARQLENLGRAEIAGRSLQGRGGIVITRDLEEAVALANAYAPEHLCLSVRDPWRWAEKVTCAGGVFLGEHSFEVLGDYAAGPSHVMPTGGSARFASPLNVWDFVHIVSLIALDPPTAAKIATPAAVIAHAEGLDGHARAAEKRL